MLSCHLHNRLRLLVCQSENNSVEICLCPSEVLSLSENRAYDSPGPTNW